VIEKRKDGRIGMEGFDKLNPAEWKEGKDGRSKTHGTEEIARNRRNGSMG
jgi:hypothetical protein